MLSKLLNKKFYSIHRAADMLSSVFCVYARKLTQTMDDPREF